jgi:hypothetical protein
VKEESDGGREGEDDWNKEMRHKRDKIEATTLEQYRSQLNKNDKVKIEWRINEKDS